MGCHAGTIFNENIVANRIVENRSVWHYLNVFHKIVWMTDAFRKNTHDQNEQTISYISYSSVPLFQDMMTDLPCTAYSHLYWLYVSNFHISNTPLCVNEANHIVSVCSIVFMSGGDISVFQKSLNKPIKHVVIWMAEYSSLQVFYSPPPPPVRESNSTSLIIYRA